MCRHSIHTPPLGTAAGTPLVQWAPTGQFWFICYTSNLFPDSTPSLSLPCKR